MISLEVVSEEKKWSKKLKKKNFFLILFVNHSQKNINLIKKKISLTLLLSNNKDIKKLKHRELLKILTLNIIFFSI